MKGRPETVPLGRGSSIQPGWNPRLPRHPKLRPAQPAGFSLLELLVVVAIMLILTGLYWRSGSGTRQQHLQLSCQQNLQKIFIALQIYAGENGGKFPVTPGALTAEQALDVLVPHYTVDTSVFTCPASKDSPLPAGESFRQRRISYAYYMGRRLSQTPEVLMSDRQVNTLAKTVGAPVFSTTGRPPANNHQRRGGNFLFSDGHTDPSPSGAPVALGLTSGVVLLNPRE
jgi:prepilin-type N-terminal cleavage/methylation domain-containing protein/prepilin-type processing-associated H-X9-DG protein